ncbi:MAG: helix-turn-helix domain-containing protein [Dehalococcoidia bacterium]
MYGKWAVSEQRQHPHRGRPREAAIDHRVAEAALRLAASGDLEAISVDQIAREARTSKSSIYRRWGTRELLLEAVVRAAWQEQPAIPEGANLRDDLRLLLHWWLALCGTSAGSLAVRGLAAPPNSRTEPARLAAELARGRLQESVSAIVRRWRIACDEALVSDVVLSVGLVRRASGAGDVSDEWALGLTDLLLDGLLRHCAEPERSSP